MTNVFKQFDTYARQSGMTKDRQSDMYAILDLCLKSGLVPSMKELDILYSMEHSCVSTILEWERNK